MRPAVGPELSVVIPAYNTGAFIESSLATVSSYLSRQDVTFEIVVVDDASTDDTLERLRTLTTHCVRPISVTRNQGKGAAIKRGILAAASPFIVTTDADIPYGPEAISRCHSELRRGAVLVVGDRRLPESREVARVSAGRRLLSQVYSSMLWPLVFPSGLRDIQCGIKGFRAEFAARFVSKSRVNRFAFDLEVIVFAIQNRVVIERMPVELVNNDMSSFRPVRDSLTMFWDVLRIARDMSKKRYRVEPRSALESPINRPASGATRE